MTQDYFTALKKWSDISLNKKDSNWDVGAPQRLTLESFDDEDGVSELFLNMPPQWSGAAHANFSNRNMNIAHISPDTYKELLKYSMIVDLDERMS